jgi:hypothetical protein
VQIQVLALYLDDEGRPLWNYNHIEAVPATGDAEQMLLAARGKIDDHLRRAKEAIGTQAEADLKRLADEAKP